MHSAGWLGYSDKKLKLCLEAFKNGFNHVKLKWVKTSKMILEDCP